MQRPLTKEEELSKLQSLLERQKSLPHLYGNKFYKWQRRFFESTNRKNLLTAANQVGKSSVNIRKCIHWATEKSLWKKLWPLQIVDEDSVPGQVWYLYPDAKLATVEYTEKWLREFLPRGAMKEDPVYGWKEHFDGSRKISHISFNSGVNVYFKTYAQNAQSLQAGTCYAIFCDEELPENLYDELKFRLSATDGYFHMVFTATLNQELWRLAMEERGKNEKFPDAFKQQISLYDCMRYEDGTPGPWTSERINERVLDCSSDTEVQRRIYGKFVTEEGLKYHQYNPATCTMQPRQIPSDWLVYEGVDIGSGGKNNHPAAITFIAVNPDFSEGEVFLGWRGDDEETTAGDILEKHFKLLDENELTGKIVSKRYDYHSKDFFTIAERAGEFFEPANKKHDEGEDVLNTLFRYGKLRIHLTGELEKLCAELVSLLRDTDKRKAKDDFSDSLRYCAATIPWNWDKIKVSKAPRKRKEKTEIELRREMFVTEGQEVYDEIEREISEWNSLYEA